MAWKAPVKQSQDIDPIPEDSYHAVCYAVCDLGTHNREYQNQKRERHEMVLIFEVPDVRIDVEKENSDGAKKIQDLPRAISKRYTFSMSQKASLRADMETWRGKAFTELEAADFDFEKLVGANAILQIVHGESKSGSKFSKIQSITKLLKGMEKKELENPPLLFVFDGQFNGEFPETMPEWVVDECKKSLEYDVFLGNAELDARDEEKRPEADSTDSSDLPF